MIRHFYPRSNIDYQNLMAKDANRTESSKRSVR
jgi:hypothetical protein